MTHRIKPGGRYKLDPNGPVYENTLPHAIIVDRQPIHVGGRVEGDPIDLLQKRAESFFDLPVVFDIDRLPFDTVFLNGMYGKMAARPSAAGRWMPTLCSSLGEPWPSPKKDSPFPAFVAPERPAEPEAPKPTPDTPAVATLKALLADRQGEVFSRRLTVMSVTEEVARLEEELVRERKDLAHAETVLAAAETEVNAIVSDIEKLGGTVEVQS